MLRVANPSFTTLSPRRPVENTDDAASNPPIPPMPTDGKPTSAKPSGTSQRSGRPSSRTHEISADPSSTLNVLHPGIPRSSPGPSRELLSDEPRPFSTSGDCYCGYLLSAAHGISTAHIDNHEAQIRINQIAEVTQIAIPPFGSHHASVVGACVRKSKVEGEGYHRTSEVMWSQSHNPNIVRAPRRHEGGGLPTTHLSGG